MKSLKQIKNELHKCIDGIRDEKELMIVYENTLKRSKIDLGNEDKNKNIFKNQQKKESEKVNYQSPDDKRSMARWFNEGGKNAC